MVSPSLIQTHTEIFILLTCAHEGKLLAATVDFKKKGKILSLIRRLPGDLVLEEPGLVKLSDEEEEGDDLLV